MRAAIGALLGPALAACVLLSPMPVSDEAHRLAAIAVLVVVFWICEPIPIPVTALLGSVLCIAAGVAPANVVLAPYADPVIFLFLGAFLLGEALSSTGLDARLARTVVASAGRSASPRRVLAAIGLLTMAMSMWMSNTATAAILMPLALSALRGQGWQKECRDGRNQEARAPGASAPPAPGLSGATVVLTVAYGASIGGIATPVGTPPNLIGLGLLERASGVHLDFLRWMAIGLPLALALAAAILLPPLLSGRRAANVPRTAATAGLPPWSRAEVTVAAVFFLMVAAWLAPSLLPLAMAKDAAEAVGGRMPESAVAMAGAALLFALPARVRPWTPILRWSQAGSIDWGTILMFGGGLSLGGLFLKTGLGEWLGEVALRATGVSSAFGLIALAAGSAVVLTEFMSNVAATNVVVPVIIAMSAGMGVEPTAPVVAATLGASMAFVLPISTAPNAIAYGTGQVTIPQMAWRGLLLDSFAFVAIVGWVAFAHHAGWV